MDCLYAGRCQQTPAVAVSGSIRRRHVFMRILVKCLAILAVLLPGPAFAQVLTFLSRHIGDAPA